MRPRLMLSGRTHVVLTKTVSRQVDTQVGVGRVARIEPVLSLWMGGRILIIFAPLFRLAVDRTDPVQIERR